MGSKREQKTVCIVRGISGSGKSILVQDLGIAGIICSADEFFTNHVTGEYKFDPYKLAQAHSECFNKFIRCLKSDSHSIIVVDNTNIHVWEFINYIELAKKMGHRVEIHEIKVTSVQDLALCFKRCNHGVPLERILQMAVEWEDYDCRPASETCVHGIYAKADKVIKHVIYRPVEKGEKS